MSSDLAGEFVRLLQMSISPIALISGVGLLLLSVTNRLARVIDRSRLLAAALRAAARAEIHDARGVERDRAQLLVLVRRARLLWSSIAMVMVTVLGSCAMIVLLTSMAFLHVDLRHAVVALFFVAALSLLVGALFFFGDVLLALRALRTEIADVL
jgi:hypothetical protein